jgi:hypothetical protein
MICLRSHSEEVSFVHEQKITAEMKVAEVVEQHPETVEVFLGKGCPDMRKGVVKFMAKVMSVKAAARVHRISLDRLLEDLNAAVRPATESLSAVGSQGRRGSD